VAPTRYLSESNRWIGVSVLITIALYLVWWGTQTQRPAFSFVSILGEPPMRSHTESTGHVVFTLLPGAFYSFKFAVPAHQLGDSRLDPRIEGTFSVENTDGDGISVFVLNKDDFKNWQKGYTTYRYYDSGSVKHGAVAVRLRDWSAGTYYVVFQNRPPGAGAKTVTANLQLAYSTIQWPGMAE
jgi:hypothetical protein